jgi:hypothetical protein
MHGQERAIITFGLVQSQRWLRFVGQDFTGLKWVSAV